MRKIIHLFSLFVICSLLLTPAVLAAQPTASASANQSSADDKSKELLERLATRVAELRQMSHKAYSGNLKSINAKTIILTAIQGEKTVITDENTVFFRIDANGKREINLSSLKMDDYIAAFGQVELEKSEMKGKIIIAKEPSLAINGRAIDVDTENGTITLQTGKRGSFIVDIEVFTKILAWDKTEIFKKYGFSKIKVGDRIHLNGFMPAAVKDGASRLTANRVLVLPAAALGIINPATPSATPSATSK